MSVLVGKRTESFTTEEMGILLNKRSDSFPKYVINYSSLTTDTRVNYCMGELDFTRMYMDAYSTNQKFVKIQNDLRSAALNTMEPYIFEIADHYYDNVWKTEDTLKNKLLRKEISDLCDLNLEAPDDFKKKLTLLKLN